MFSYSTGYYVSLPDDQYLKFKNRCSLRVVTSKRRLPKILMTDKIHPVLTQIISREEMKIF